MDNDDLCSIRDGLDELFGLHWNVYHGNGKVCCSYDHHFVVNVGFQSYAVWKG